MLFKIVSNEDQQQNAINSIHFFNSFTSYRIAPHIILQNHLLRYFKRRLFETTVHQGFKNYKFWYMFFREPNNMFAYTIVHLKQSFVHECTLTCTLPYIYYNDRRILEQKVNLRSIQNTIKLVCVSRLFFTEKETTDGSLVYPELNNQITFRQLCSKALNMVGLSQCLLV